MTVRWRGGAAAVSWVLYVVPGSVSAGNEFSLTLDSKTVTYLTAAGTVADVIAGLAAAIAATGVPAEWLDVTAAAGASGTYLQLTPTVPGTPIGTVTASAAVGSGTTTPTLTCSSTLATPVNGAFASGGTTGGALSNGTYYYRISAINAAGETLASAETSLTLSGGTSTQKINLAWSQVPGALGYRIYGRSTGAEQFITGVTGETTLAYTDLGSIAPSGALPASNTTGVSGQGPFDFNVPANWDANRVPQSAVAAPAGLASALASGGTLTNGTTYYYKITATNANGETTASNETSQTADMTHGTVNLTWTATAWAQGYNIYRGTSSGAENKLIGTAAASATSFSDNGVAGSTQSPPGVNTAVGDDVVFSSASYDCLYNLAQNYPLYSSLTIDLSMQAGNNGQGCIGLPEQNVGGYIEYRPTYVQVSPATFTIGNGNGAGATRWKLDFGTNPYAGLVNGTGNGDSGAGLEALLIKGVNAGNALTVNKGLVGVAVFAGETAQLATLNVNFRDNPQSDAQVRCGAGATLGAVVKGGGILVANSSITSFTQDGGETWHYAGAIGTVVLEGGTLHENASGTCLTAAVTVYDGAFLDMSEDARSKTITPRITFYKGAKYRDPLGRVTLTNGYTIPDGSANQCDLDFGPNRVYTAA